jgi:hypothetical protein
MSTTPAQMVYIGKADIASTRLVEPNPHEGFAKLKRS